MPDFLLKSAVALSLATCTIPAPADAQNISPNGAVTGAVAEGTGAITGAATDQPPSKVLEYVVAQPIPDWPLVLPDQIVIGKPVPETVFLTPVPGDRRYAYAVVNHRRVIADLETRTVVQVVK